MCTKVVLVIFTIMLSFELITSPAQGLTKDQFKKFKGKVDPADGKKYNTDALKDFCNRAAKKKTLIHPNESLEFDVSFPKIVEVIFTFEDGKDEGKTNIVLCSSKQSKYFSIGKGESKYGAFEFRGHESGATYPSYCVPEGNIASVFV